MDPSVLLIAGLAGAAVSLTVLYALGRASEPHDAVRTRLAGQSTSRPTRPELSLILRQPRRQLLTRLLPLSDSAIERLNAELARAGWQLRPGEYVVIRIAAAGCVAVLAQILLGRFNAPDGVVRTLALLGGLYGGWMVPALLLRRARARRLRTIEEQLPEALTSISKALRSGAGVIQALGYAARETDEPLGPELQAALRDLDLGADAQEVFVALGERVGSQDLDIVVTAILIQRSAGGNLSDILMNVTATIRSRANLQREMRVLTARQRTTANMVAVAPLVIAGLLMMVNPKMGSSLFESSAGRIALAAGAALELLGFLLIRRFSTIEV